jgi:cytochrome c oxidase subunit 2
VIGAGFLTVLVLAGFLIYDFSLGRALAQTPFRGITIKVTGYQWWWHVLYVDPDQSKQVVSANEIHIPVGEPVQISLESRDVIHSFWVPNLVGKRDLIPGYKSSIWFKADSAGVYRGQCAEFCGLQHAKMALVVIAEPKEQFQAWLESQYAAPPEPSDPVTIKGREVFLAGQCSLCHAVAGTEARGTRGPDLTHIASRRTLAAGTLPNTRGHLAGWIIDPQAIKPGTHMPSNQLSSSDLQALLSYLETLK